MKRALILAAALVLGACSTVTDTRLHGDRNSDGSVYLSPDCVAHLAEVRALVVPTLRVKRDNPLLRNKERDAQGAWLFGTIIVRDDLASWVEEDTMDHEKCHQWTFNKTGSPQFHR